MVVQEVVQVHQHLRCAVRSGQVTPARSSRLFSCGRGEGGPGQSWTGRSWRWPGSRAVPSAPSAMSPSCLRFRVWGLGCGVWCVVCGVWCVVCGVWCVVCGVWCVVCGVWCVVCGVWCMVCGVCGVLCMVCGVCGVVSGVRCVGSGFRKNVLGWIAGATAPSTLRSMPPTQFPHARLLSATLRTTANRPPVRKWPCQVTGNRFVKRVVGRGLRLRL